VEVVKEVGSLKSQGKIFTTSAPLTPLGKTGPVRPDLRAPITAWAALVWAYHDELVHAASNVGAAWYADTGYAQSQLGVERVSGGLINGVLEAHEDAVMIHAKMREWFSGHSEGLTRLIWVAERRIALAPEISLPRVRVMPRRDKNGEVIVMRLRPYRGARVETEYCEVEYEGLSLEVAAAREQAYREFYALFLAFLDAMPGFKLVKWKVEGRGLTNVDESLTKGSIDRV
jgi:hypothetical protein